MAFDGLFIHSLLTDLSPTLINARLTKIYQPFSQDLILNFRKDRHNHKLLISANAQSPRFYLTKQAIVNPDVAPTFVMVLRKYLEGAVLEKIWQIGLDRIVNLSFSNRNELGDQMKLVLSIELMGRHSNVILYDQSSEKIIDLLKRVNPDENRVRLLLPKAAYQLPPLTPKINGFSLSKQDFAKLKKEKKQPQDFAAEMAGLDYDDRNELIGYWEDDFSFQSLQLFLDQFSNPKGYLFRTANQKLKLFPYLPYHLDLIKVSESDDLNAFLSNFYQKQANREWVRQRAHRIITIVHNENKKLTKKIHKLTAQRALAEDSEDYRIKGELLNTYLNQVKPGMTKVSLPNYYENNKPLLIKLDPALSPARNGQKYFTRYQKLRNSIKYINEQIAIAQDDLTYFDSIQSAVDNAEPQDIDAILDELIANGFLHQKKPARKKRISEKNLPQFTLTSGKNVLVGKNNYENDWLTLKKAQKNDYWFHVKNMPGSHVILRDDHPTFEDIKESAEIAAFFSKGKNSSHVTVDYVQAKRVKKPKGAKPGFVIYTGQNSIEVTPDEKTVLGKKNEGK